MNSNEHTLPRRTLLAAAALLPLGAPVAGSAQTLGDKSGRIISGFPAGGGMDPLVRMLADKLRGKYAKAMIVENRAGAGGRIAIEAARTSPGDGATLLFTPESPMVIFPHIYKKLAYDPVKDFMPVTTIFSIKMGLVVGPGAPVKTLAEYLAWVKQDPKRAVYGSPGAGTMPHFLGAMFARATEVPFTHIAYRGGAPMALELMGGQLPAAFQPIGFDSVDRHKNGRLRVLAIAENARTKQLPEVPTFAELGYKTLLFNEWFGLFVPAATPPDTVRSLAAQVHAAMREPDIQAWLENGQADMLLSTPEEMASRVRGGSAEWSRIVRETGYSPEE